MHALRLACSCVPNSRMGSPSPPSLFWKGVASTNLPLSAPALEVMLSTSMPMVMRDGKACGLMIRSGLQRAQYIDKQMNKHQPMCIRPLESGARVCRQSASRRAPCLLQMTVLV